MIDNWIWIVLIIGVFWFMHRRGMGCCGGHGHSHGKGSDEHGEHDEMCHREESKENAEGVKAERR